MKRAFGLGLALVAGVSGGSAWALDSKSDHSVRCVVTRAEKLPTELSAASLCDAVGAAAAPALREHGHAADALSVVIVIDNEAKLTANATLAGTPLREHHIATADRPLNGQAVAMLANAIAADIASAGQ